MKRMFNRRLFYILFLLTIIVELTLSFSLSTLAVDNYNYNSDNLCSNGHQYNHWTIIQQPTTTREGEKSSFCMICGNYEIVKIQKLIPISVGEVKITSYSKTHNALKIYWTKAKNAIGYRVYMKENDTWKVVSNIFNGTNNLYIGNLQQGKNYEFCVRGFAKNVDGAYSFGAVSSSYIAKTSTKVNLEKTSIGCDSLKLNWTKTPGVTGYFVRQKINGTWKTLKYLSATTTSYLVTGLEQGEQYEFYVGAYTNDYLGKVIYSIGAFDTVKTLKTQVSIKSSYAKTDSALKIYWDKIPFATGYRVYFYDNYKLISAQNVTTNSYYKGSLKSGNNYQFIVKAYRINLDKTVTWYENSKVMQTATNLSTAKISSSITGITYTKLYWNKIENATGYRIYLKVNGKWTIVKDIYNKYASSYYIFGLKSKTKYEFRISAFSTALTPTAWARASESCFITTR